MKVQKEMFRKIRHWHDDIYYDMPGQPVGSVDLPASLFILSHIWTHKCLWDLISKESLPQMLSVRCPYGILKCVWTRNSHGKYYLEMF